MNRMTDGSLKLEYEDILHYLKNRPPLLMIDSAVVKPGCSAFSNKYLRQDDWYFPCHFPGNPMMPGVLQLESVFQTAALAIKTLQGNQEKTTNISRIKYASYFKPILPEMFITIMAEVQRYHRGVALMKGEICSEDVQHFSTEFILAIPEDMVLIQ